MPKVFSTWDFRQVSDYRREKATLYLLTGLSMSFTHIFITHSSKDQAIAQEMLEYLESRGIRCWIAPRDIPLGMQWAEAILDAIEEASAMLLIFSANSNDSPQVLREVERAVSMRVPIYPVKIEEVEPCRAMEYYLSSHQWKEVLSGDIDKSLSRLVPTIRRHLGLDPTPERQTGDGPGSGYPGPGHTGHATGSRWWKKLLYIGLPAAAVAIGAAVLFGGGDSGVPADTGVPDTSAVSDSSAVVDSLPSGPVAGDLTEGPVTGMVFSYIPSGSFLMGSPDDEPGRDADEGPPTRIDVQAFEIMTTEVTQLTWEYVMESNPSYNRQAGDFPVENVSWEECAVFLERLNSMDPDHGYRLPSESEWEYACRSGSDDPWFWGDDSSGTEVDLYCWFDGNSGGETHPVSEKLPSAWGLYDTAGNVLEWCDDYYHGDLTSTPADGTPCRVAGDDSTFVVRGGSARNSPSGCRSASRSSYPRDGTSPGIGFRVVRTAVGE
jgi:formylglycine-generating enzyme required for sulfatase activity